MTHEKELAYVNFHPKSCLDFKQDSEERPKKCPDCGGETFQRWGQVNKKVKDTHLGQVKCS